MDATNDRRGAGNNGSTHTSTTVGTAPTLSPGMSTTSHSSSGGSGSGAAMTEADQKLRRNNIREILANTSLTPLEKRRSIQTLMDGRRRSSNATASSSNGSISEMARAAAEASEFYSSDTDDDVAMHDEGNNESSYYPQHYYHASSSASSSPLPIDPLQQQQYINQQAYYQLNNQQQQQQQYEQQLQYQQQQQQQFQYQQQQQQQLPPNQPNPNNDNNNNSDLDNMGNTHVRKQRSASLPFWSEGGGGTMMQAAPVCHPVGSSNSIWDDPININRRMEKSRPPCTHYERNCTIISPCCGLAFGCRICHDECPVLPLPFSKRPSPPNNMNMATGAVAAGGAGGVCIPVAPGQQQQQQLGPSHNNIVVDSGKTKQEKRRSLPLGFDDEETHHDIDRFAIKEIICRLCYTRQSSKTNFCIACQSQFGAYHCSICNLWMSDDESPYHCPDCGFCRVGGRENFRHCHDCGMCIDTLLFDDHNCKAGKYMSNCPVCQEDLFSSRDASHEMPCGHAIHWHCFKELTSYDTRCPVCKKTAETHEHMAPTWHAMAMGIALQPVPPELARVVTIMCNDCEERDIDRRWHFLGVRCLHCMSFNTAVERTSMTGREAAAYLDELDRMRGGSLEGQVMAAGMSGASAIQPSSSRNNNNNNNNWDDTNQPMDDG